jgi:hypothetical protein
MVEREALFLPEEGGQYAGHKADHVCPHKLGLVEREANQQQVEGSALHKGRRVLNNGAVTFWIRITYTRGGSAE